MRAADQNVCPNILQEKKAKLTWKSIVSTFFPNSGSFGAFGHSQGLGANRGCFRKGSSEGSPNCLHLSPSLLGFLRRVAQLSATFVLSFVLRLSPTFVSECLRFFVSQSLKFSGASGACLKCSSEGFPAVVYVCLPIVLGRFRELLLHWSLSFCSSLVPLVPLVLVLEFAFLRNGILTKKAINPCTPALHKKINHVVWSLLGYSLFV